MVIMLRWRLPPDFFIMFVGKNGLAASAEYKIYTSNVTQMINPEILFPACYLKIIIVYFAVFFVAADIRFQFIDPVSL